MSLTSYVPLPLAFYPLNIVLSTVLVPETALSCVLAGAVLAYELGRRAGIGPFITTAGGGPRAAAAASIGGSAARTMLSHAPVPTAVSAKILRTIEHHEATVVVRIFVPADGNPLPRAGA